MQEARRERDLFAGDRRQPTPVPACEHEFECLLDSGAEPQPPRKPLRHLAHGREGLAGSRRIGEGALDHLRAHLRRPVGPHVGAVEREDLLAVGRVDEEEGRPVLDVLAEDKRRLVPVRRAAGGVEEGDVVGVGDLLGGRSRELAEAGGEDRRAQRVLERLPRAEVGREREGADQLGGADVCRRTGRFHVLILCGRNERGQVFAVAQDRRRALELAPR